MNSARIRAIASWLPTLDEARLREVEDFVLAKAIEQQDSASDSAPARADVSHGNPQAGGGTFTSQEQSNGNLVHGASVDDVYRADDDCGRNGRLVPRRAPKGQTDEVNCEGCGADVAATTSFGVPPWKRLCYSCLVKHKQAEGRSEALSAPSHPSNGSQLVGGGTFTEAEYAADVAGVVAYAAKTGRAVVVRPDGSARVVISIPTADDAIESGLRELATATPQVAAPGVADDHTLWSAEMVDGRFDGSDE